MEYLKKDEVINILKKRFDENNRNDYDAIPWIMIHVLRLLKDQFSAVEKVDYVSVDRMIEATERYINGESISEIFGDIEFYGRRFKTCKGVFDPKLSSEALINAVVKNIEPDDDLNVLDLCCGTGCITITLEKILKCNVYGVDISDKALTVSRKNALILSSNAQFSKMDILDDWDKEIGIPLNCIVSNPPYWSSKKIFEEANAQKVNSNPIEAFDGGEDGLKFHREIIKNAPKYLVPKGMLFLEIDDDQEENIRKLLEKDFDNIQVEKDYRGITRVIYGTKK